MSPRDRFWNPHSISDKIDPNEVNPPINKGDQVRIDGTLGPEATRAMGRGFGAGMSAGQFLRSTTVDIVNPLSISGCVTWIAARNHPEYYDGDVCDHVTDVSGTGHTHTQATVSRRPIFRRQAIGGMPGFYFDGIDDVLSHTYVVPLVRPTTWIIVAALDLPDDNGLHTLWDFSNVTEWNHQMDYTPPQWVLQATGETGISGLIDTNPHIHICEFGVANTTLRIDALIGGPTGAVGTNGGASNIGSRVADQRMWKGPISEWIAYSKILDPSTERIPLINSLKQIYGMSF